jgi:hypothetical protein
MFVFIGVIAGLILFLVICSKIVDVDGYMDAYKQEREATQVVQELDEETKRAVVKFVEANYPGEVNEKILSETISVRSRVKKQEA